MRLGARLFESLFDRTLIEFLVEFSRVSNGQIKLNFRGNQGENFPENWIKKSQNRKMQGKGNRLEKVIKQGENTRRKNHQKLKNRPLKALKQLQF